MKKETFPESMTVGDWQALLRLAAEKVALEWLDANPGAGLRHLLGEECPDCDRGVATTANGGRYLCHSCGGTGLELREGVWVCRTEANDNCEKHTFGEATAIAFPASMMKGD